MFDATAAALQVVLWQWFRAAALIWPWCCGSIVTVHHAQRVQEASETGSFQRFMCAQRWHCSQGGAAVHQEWLQQAEGRDSVYQVRCIAR